MPQSSARSSSTAGAWRKFFLQAEPVSVMEVFAPEHHPLRWFYQTAANRHRHALISTN
jgi:hypothetical protein